MSLNEHFRAIWRRLPWILVISALVAVAVYGFRSSADDVYSSTATVDVVAPREDGTSLASEQVEVVTGRFVALADTSAVLRQAIDASGLDLTIEEARELVSASSSDPGFVDVTADGPTPEAAQELANAVVGELATFGAAGETANLVIVSEAELPKSASAPKPRRDAAFAFVVAFIINAEAVAIFSAMRGRFTPRRERDELEVAAGSAVLATIPRRSKGWAAESYRTLRASFELATTDVPVRSVTVLGVAPSTTSSIAFGLAQASANSKVSVCLVEADLERPVMVDAINLPSSPSVVSVVGRGTVAWDDLHQMNPLQPHFRALPAGDSPDDARPTLGSGVVRKLIGQFDDVELVVVDAPPVSRGVDALVIATQTDGVVLVVHANERKRTATDAVRQLRSLDVRVIGTVLVDRRRRRRAR